MEDSTYQLRVVSEEIEHLQKQHEEIGRQATRLETEVEALSTEASNLMKECDLSKEANTKLSTIIRAYDFRHQADQEKIARYEEKMARYEEKIARLIQELTQVRKERDELLHEIKELEKKYEELKSIVASLTQRRNANVKDRLEALIPTKLWTEFESKLPSTQQHCVGSETAPIKIQKNKVQSDFEECCRNPGLGDDGAAKKIVELNPSFTQKAVDVLSEISLCVSKLQSDKLWVSIYNNEADGHQSPIGRSFDNAIGKHNEIKQAAFAFLESHPDLYCPYTNKVQDYFSYVKKHLREKYPVLEQDLAKEGKLRSDLLRLVNTADNNWLITQNFLRMHDQYIPQKRGFLHQLLDSFRLIFAN